MNMFQEDASARHSVYNMFFNKKDLKKNTFSRNNLKKFKWCKLFCQIKISFYILHLSISSQSNMFIISCVSSIMVIGVECAVGELCSNTQPIYCIHFYTKAWEKHGSISFSYCYQLYSTIDSDLQPLVTANLEERLLQNY